MSDIDNAAPQRLTTTPRLRRAIYRRISNFGCGRMEVHSAVLEALVNDAERAAARADQVKALTQRAEKAETEARDVRQAAQTMDRMHIKECAALQREIECLQGERNVARQDLEATESLLRIVADDTRKRCAAVARITDLPSRHVASPGNVIASAIEALDPGMVPDPVSATAPEMLSALEGVLPYMAAAEKAGLVGHHEGGHWPVEAVRAAIAAAKEP
ncbi:MAG: hypothetical protein F8N39_11490 [Clostridiaceae bacterium]|nr:hypothetical protein [Clostridiaceae bacterium]